MNMFSGEAAGRRPVSVESQGQMPITQPPGYLRGSGVGGRHGGTMFGSEAGAAQAAATNNGSQALQEAEAPTAQS